jgi:putative Holliday junction resolvase
MDVATHVDGIESFPAQGTPKTVRGRVVGLDLGARRIGVAVSDSDRVLAFARAILERSGNVAKDLAEIASIVNACDATLVVVGLPLSLGGGMGPAAKKALDEIAALKGALSVPVEAFDERLTTVEALSKANLVTAETTAARGVSASGSHRKARVVGPSRKKRAVDDEAAAAILQSYLDYARHR